MKAVGNAASALLLALSSSTLAQEEQWISEAAKAVEAAFIDTEVFTVYRSLSEIPPNEYLLLVGDGDYFAELGEDFNTSDVVSEGLPRQGAQHLFTAISRDVVAFVYVGSGMTGTRLYLVLKGVGAESGCLYSWDDWGLAGLRVRALQETLQSLPFRRPESRFWSTERRGGWWGKQC